MRQSESHGQEGGTGDPPMILNTNMACKNVRQECRPDGLNPAWAKGCLRAITELVSLQGLEGRPTAFQVDKGQKGIPSTRGIRRQISEAGKSMAYAGKGPHVHC